MEESKSPREGTGADGMADTPIGFNLSIGEVDTEDKSPDGLLHHETWWAGKMTPRNRTPRVKLWGTLVLTSQRKDRAEPSASGSSQSK